MGGSSGGGGSTNTVTGAAQYVPQNQPAADQALYSATQAQAAAPNYPLQNYQQMQSVAQNYINNPYAASAQTAANTSGAQTGQLAQQQQQQGNMYNSEASSLAPYAAQIMNMGLDPQNALYNQQLQQTTDQANALNSMYGLGSSPVGAGVAGQDLNNFNLAWQNNQLQRAATGASAAEGVYGTQQNLGNAGNTLNTSSAQNQLAAGTIPYSQYGTNLASQLQALSGLNSSALQTQTLPQNTINNLQQYLGIGNTGNALAAQNSNNAFSALGSGLNGLGSLASSAFGGTGSSAASGASSLSDLSDLSSDTDDADSIFDLV